MITSESELAWAKERIAYFERILGHLRATATPEEFRSVTSGYRAELERMQAAVAGYLTRPLETASHSVAA